MEFNRDTCAREPLGIGKAFINKQVERANRNIGGWQSAQVGSAGRRSIGGNVVPAGQITQIGDLAKAAALACPDEFAGLGVGVAGNTRPVIEPRGFEMLESNGKFASVARHQTQAGC